MVLFHFFLFSYLIFDSVVPLLRPIKGSGYCLTTYRMCCLLFNLVFWLLLVICRLHNRCSQLNSIMFISLFGAFHFIRYWDHTPYDMGNTLKKDNSMSTVICMPSSGMVKILYCWFYEYWVLLNPGLEGVSGSKHISLPLMNSLNQTDTAIFRMCRARFPRSIIILFFYKQCSQARICGFFSE